MTYLTLAIAAAAVLLMLHRRLQRGATPPAPALEPAPDVATHVGAEDDEATGAWLAAMQAVDEPDDAWPLDSDIETLFARQDFELAIDWVRELEARLAAEFALVELAGTSR